MYFSGIFAPVPLPNDMSVCEETLTYSTYFSLFPYHEHTKNNMKITLTSLVFSLLSLAVASSAELMECYPDSTGKFIVAGTWGNEKRSCSWAARRNTEEERCEIEIVVEQCPITCKVPCQQPRDIIVAGATSAEEVEPGRKGVGFLIVGCTLLGVAALALIVLAVVQEIKDRGCTATSVLLDLFHIRKGDKETSDDELSKQSSLDLNANEDIELTMSGSVIIESATSVSRQYIIDTQEVQEDSRFCCDPLSSC